jgi:titin
VVTSPRPPENLRATKVTSRAIDLTWDDRSSSEDGFKVMVSTDGIHFSEVDRVLENVTQYRFEARPNQHYWFWVRSFDENGVSDVANVYDVLTPADPPAGPNNLDVYHVWSSAIDLKWADRSDDEAGFIIKMSADGEHFEEIGRVGANTTRFEAGGLAPHHHYWFRVKAFNANGESDHSNTVDVVTSPRPPENLRATKVTSRAIDLTWDDRSSSEDGFKVMVSTDGIHFSEVDRVLENVTRYRFTARPNQHYWFWVRSFDENGVSDVASVLEVVTPRDPPP